MQSCMQYKEVVRGRGALGRRGSTLCEREPGARGALHAAVVDDSLGT